MADQVFNYVTGMRAMFNKKALFSDESPNYRIPFEPATGDMVTIRFRTLKNNVDTVYYISGSQRLKMSVAFTRNGFDYYEIEIPVGREPIHYFFEIRYNDVICYYNRLGVTRELQEMYSFCIVPNFSTPDWSKGAVMYQIYVDRFCNGDSSNDVLTNEYYYIDRPVKKVEDWHQLPEKMDVGNFYGGDLQGVIQKLDYLKELGIEVVYLNPIFVSPSNHKYDIQDYEHVDPHFGKLVSDQGDLLPAGDKDNTHATRYIDRVTNMDNLTASDEVLIELVQQAHKRGMKVILDGVFNHCGSFNKWMDREKIYENGKGYEAGAFVSKDSPYHDFFKFNNEHSWPYNEFYDGWWNHNTLPKLNYESSRDLVNKIFEVGRKWVSEPFCCDGWRLDVAADLGQSQEFNHWFWREFRKVVKKANPNAIILAEHYGDARSWLQGDQWDTVMNYDAFMEPVSWFLTGMEKHSDEFNQGLLGNAQSFIGAMRYNMPAFHAPSLYTAMNELDNHDHSRFLTRTNHKVGRVASVGSAAAGENVNPAVLREAVVIQMTWPGAPTLYYGNEAGVVGFTDPDNRRTYPWGKEDKNLLQFYREIIQVHHDYPVLKTGSLIYLYDDYNLLSYARFDDKEQVIVIVNNRTTEVKVEIPVWLTGISRKENSVIDQVYMTNAVGYSKEKKTFELTAGILEYIMPPVSAVVFHRNTNQTADGQK